MSSNKPFPSSDLDVFKENSLILDNFVNSQENEHPDRFARKRPTITGIIKEAFNVRTDISNMNETLIGQSRWDVVPKNTSLSLGGDNGALNKQAQALFNRTVMLKVHTRETLRRTYQEVGLNLVEGSFEEGGELKTITDVLLEEKTSKVYSWSGSFPKVVNEGTLPTSEVEYVEKSDLIFLTVNDVEEVKNLNLVPGGRVLVTSNHFSLYHIEGGVSEFQLINPQITPNVFLSLIPINGVLSTKAAGCKDEDDTKILDQLIRYGKKIQSSVLLDCPVTLVTPLDSVKYISIPADSTFYSENPRLYRIKIKPKMGVVVETGLCLETFKGLQGDEPEMCSGSVVKDIYITLDRSDGGEVKVGHCIIGGMFRTMFIRPYASGFSRHNILICRTWYSTIQGPFGRAGLGNGVTIGKHPDVNPGWDGAVNAINIDEVWGHGNGLSGTWSPNDNEDLGYGVGIYGANFSLTIGKCVCEGNRGAGFQNKLSYGNFNIESMYLENNKGHDYYSASVRSSGISWSTPNVFLSRNANVKVNHDPNTTASLIGFPFAIDSNVFDFSGVNFANVKLSKETCYPVRSKLGQLMSTDYKIVSSEDGDLNKYDVLCKGVNPVSSLIFDNNMELIFIPYKTTTSTDQFVYQITKNGADQGTTLGKAGPFTAFQQVKLTTWTGSHDVFYSFKVVDSYNEPCPGRFIIKSRHL